MNEQANKILTELLQKASNGVDSAVSFSQAQIPDVINQLLVWNAVSSAISQVVSVVLIFISAILIYKGVKDKGERNPNGRWVNDDLFPDAGWFWQKDGSVSLPGGLVLGIGSTISVVSLMTFCVNFDWLKIWLAPKLYLIEYTASLITK